MMPIATQAGGQSRLDPARPASRAPVSTARHLASIHALCEEIGRPFEEMAAVYHSELARLSARASIMDYVPVLAVKHVRDYYRHQRDALEPDAAGTAPLDGVVH